MKTIFFLSICALVVPFITGTPKTKLESSTAKNTPVEAIKVEPVALVAPTPTQEVQLPDDEYASLLAKYFPADQVSKAVKIMRCESGVPNRVSKPNKNGTKDYGLMQINSIHAWRVDGDLNALLDPDTNIRVASEIYKDAGDSWNPWVCNKKVK
jgi:hypothetical protein